MSKIIKGAQVISSLSENSGMGRITYDQLEGLNQKLIILVDFKTGREYTIGEVLEYSVNLASQLRLLGVKKGENLALISENSPRFYIILLACFYLAAPVHLINPGFTKYEFKKILNLSKPKLIFTSPKAYQIINEIKDEESWIETIVTMDDFENFINNPAENFEIDDDFDPKDQTAVICNSSGTTGHPKGVMLTHNNLKAPYIIGGDPRLYILRKHEATVLVIPTYHIYGLSFLLGFAFRGKKVILSDKFEPKSFVKSIETYRVTKLFLVPLLANFLADTPLIQEYDITSVDDIFCTSTPPNQTVLDQLTEKFPNVTKVRQMYGMTEFFGGITLSPMSGPTRSGSCGVPYPGVEIKIVNSSGESSGVETPGEICVKGDFSKGYLGEEEKTLEMFDSEGFLKTGDVGYYDQDHFVYIIDRCKDLIKYKSYQVAAGEIEDLIRMLPGVKEVAVVGKPDPKFGELPVAFVVRKDPEIYELDEKQIVDFVTRHLSEEKRLHGGVLFVDEIPKNQIGKILRKRLRDTFEPQQS